MLEIDKKDIKGVLGKEKGYYLSTLTLLEGLEQIEKSTQPQNFNFAKHEKGLLINAFVGLFGKRNFYILDENISHITLKTIAEFQKDKSVIGRAAIGGLLLGPLGAVIGGMSGMGKKTVGDYLLSIEYIDENNQEKVVVFQVKQKEAEYLHSMIFNRFYPLKYNTER